jgi:transcription antitermination factor NusG
MARVSSLKAPFQPETTMAARIAQDARWYAYFVTSPTKARDEMVDAGLEVFFPTYERIVRRGRSKVLRPAPLLPGYLFARHDDEDFPVARSCQGVVRVLSSCGDPWPLPDGEVERLIELVESGRMNEALPHKKSHPRGVRYRGLESLKAVLDTMNALAAEEA